MTSLFQPFMAFLISLHASVNAMVVIFPEGTLVVSGIVAVFGLLGAWLHPRLVGLIEAKHRPKILVPLWIPYAALIVITLVNATEGNGRDVGEATKWFFAFQCLFLLFGGAGRGYLGVLQNALILVLLAGLAGGVIAAGAVTGYAVLLTFWLVFDHHERRDAPSRSAFIPALTWSLLAAVLLVSAFALVPAEPYGPVHKAAMNEGQRAAVTRAYMELIGVTVAGVVLLILVTRMLRVPARRRREIIEERIEPSRRRTIERSGPYVEEGEGLEGWRGKIVRLYVRFLHQVRKLGVRHRPDWTPAEFSKKLPADPGPLTDVFLRARYGPDDLSEADFNEAEKSAEGVIDDLRSRES